jgi:hypothetical protein
MMTAVEGNEILTAVEIELWPAGRGYSFLEYARRHGDFAIVGVANHVDRPDPPNFKLPQQRLLTLIRRVISVDICNQRPVEQKQKAQGLRSRVNLHVTTGAPRTSLSVRVCSPSIGRCVAATISPTLS